MDFSWFISFKNFFQYQEQLVNSGVHCEGGPWEAIKHWPMSGLQARGAEQEAESEDVISDDPPETENIVTLVIWGHHQPRDQEHQEAADKHEL